MTNNVRWASATLREKAFIEEVTRVTYERDRVRGSDCLCQKSALPLRHKRFDPHFATQGNERTEHMEQSVSDLILFGAKTPAKPYTPTAGGHFITW